MKHSVISTGKYFFVKAVARCSRLCNYYKQTRNIISVSRNLPDVFDVVHWFNPTCIGLPYVIRICCSCLFLPNAN